MNIFYVHSYLYSKILHKLDVCIHLMVVNVEQYLCYEQHEILLEFFILDIEQVFNCLFLGYQNYELILEYL